MDADPSWSWLYENISFENVSLTDSDSSNVPNHRETSFCDDCGSQDISLSEAVDSNFTNERVISFYENQCSHSDSGYNSVSTSPKTKDCKMISVLSDNEVQLLIQDVAQRVAEAVLNDSEEKLDWKNQAISNMVASPGGTLSQSEPAVNRNRFPKRRNPRPYNVECTFCQNNGEPAEIYKSHVLKDMNGVTRCPTLRCVVCPECHKTGDEAHTLRYCELRKQRTLKNGGVPLNFGTTPRRYKRWSLGSSDST